MGVRETCFKVNFEKEIKALLLECPNKEIAYDFDERSHSEFKNKDFTYREELADADDWEEAQRSRKLLKAVYEGLDIRHLRHF